MSEETHVPHLLTVDQFLVLVEEYANERSAFEAGMCEDDAGVWLVKTKICNALESILAANAAQAFKLRAQRQVGWSPIAEADKSGVGCDLWCVPPPDEREEFGGSRGVRLTDCFWNVADSAFPHEGWARITDDGNIDMVDSPPTCPHGLPRWVPTHFKPLAAAPTPGEVAS